MLRKFVFCAVGVLALTALAYSDTTTFAPPSIHVGKDLNNKGETPVFKVDATGKMTVTVDSRTFSAFPNDPAIRVKIELIRPDGSPAASAQPLINFFSKKTTLTYTVKDSDLHMVTKLWKVRITNIDGSNRMQSDHQVKVTYHVAVRTLVQNTSAPLTLLPGQSDERTFKLTPHTKGKLQITATWNTDLLGGGLLNPVAIKVELYRPGPNGTKVRVAHQDNMKSPLSFTYNVQSQDLVHSGDWTLVILNETGVGIDHFVPVVRFTPAAN